MKTKRISSFIATAFCVFALSFAGTGGISAKDPVSKPKADTSQQKNKEGIGSATGTSVTTMQDQLVIGVKKICEPYTGHFSVIETTYAADGQSAMIKLKGEAKSSKPISVNVSKTYLSQVKNATHADIMWIKSGGLKISYMQNGKPLHSQMIFGLTDLTTEKTVSSSTSTHDSGIANTDGKTKKVSS